MIKIAVCDDDISNLLVVRRYLDEYIEINESYDIQIYYYQTSKAILDAMLKEKFNLYILDIYIDIKSGIDIARQIRTYDTCSSMIFMSGSDRYYKEAFALGALHYLQKPIDKFEVFEALNRALMNKPEHKYTVKTAEGTQIVKVIDIYYVDTIKRSQQIVCRDNKYIVKSSIDEIYRDINEEYFFRANRQIFNVKQILKFRTGKVIMVDGHEFEVPVNVYHDIGTLMVKSSF